MAEGKVNMKRVAKHVRQRPYPLQPQIPTGATGAPTMYGNCPLAPQSFVSTSSKRPVGALLCLWCVRPFEKILPKDIQRHYTATRNGIFTVMNR